MRGHAAALLLLPALAACAGSGASGPNRPARPGTPAPAKPPAPVRQPAAPPAKDPEFHMMPGLESVIGANGADVIRQFGPARIDVREGDARKLQFSGEACVLDVYLYPTARSREPLATYVDARRASDGREVDKAACAASLKGAR